MKRSRTHAAENGRVATAPIDDSPVPGALLTLRLVGGEAGSDATWHERTPAGSLAIDLIGASGGVLVETRGSLLVARFPGVHPACLAARRLQWAMQGLAENAGAAGVALTILVQAGDDTIPDRVNAGVSELEAAPAGRILLAQRAGQVLEQEPGFAIKKTGQGALELVWRAPSQQATPAADELTLARLSAEIHGTPVAAPAQPAVQQEAPAEGTRLIPARGVQADDSERDEAPARRGRLPWILGAAAAVVVAVGGFYFFSQGPKEPKARTEPVSSTTSAGQAAGAAQTPGSPGPGLSAQANGRQGPALTAPADRADAIGSSSQRSPKREKGKPPAQEASNRPVQDVKPQPAPAQPAANETASGECLYQPDQIAGLLARAENSRARGQYEDAKRKFSAVLACDRGNAKAQAGLQQVLQAIKAEGSDNR